MSIALHIPIVYTTPNPKRAEQPDTITTPQNRQSINPKSLIAPNPSFIKPPTHQLKPSTTPNPPSVAYWKKKQYAPLNTPRKEQIHVNIETLAKEQASEVMRTLSGTATIPDTLRTAKRWSDARQTVAHLKQKILGIAVIAPHGELGSGNPTITSIYVAREHRMQGIGTKLLTTAVTYMIDQNLIPIRIDAITPYITKMVQRLPQEKQKYIALYDFSARTMRIA